MLLNKNIRERVEVGRIDLMRRFSFFEVKEEDADIVVSSLDGQSWKGYRLGVEIAGGEGAVPASKPGRKGDKGSKGGKKKSGFEDREQGRGRRGERESGRSGKRGRSDRPKNWKDDWKQFFQNDAWDREPSGKGGKKRKK